MGVLLQICCIFFNNFSWELFCRAAFEFFILKLFLSDFNIFLRLIYLNNNFSRFSKGLSLYFKYIQCYDWQFR